MNTAQILLHSDVGDAIRRSKLPPDEVLVILAQVLGYVMSKQDRALYAPEAVMLRVADNIEIGRRVDTPPSGLLN